MKCKKINVTEIFQALALYGQYKQKYISEYSSNEGRFPATLGLLNMNKKSTFTYKSSMSLG